MIYAKRNENDFVVDINIYQKNSGYNVVPRDIDPYNAYDIEEIRAYAEAHPEDEVVWDEVSGMYIHEEQNV